MSEVSLRHKVVSLEDFLNVLAVDTKSDTHDHMLGPLDDLTVDSEQVRSLQSLEAKVVVRKVTIVDDG